MAKSPMPFLSPDARGSVGPLTASKWRGVPVVKMKIQYNGSKTATQIKVRNLMKDITTAWRTNATVGSTQIDSAYKEGFKMAAAGQSYSGFNLFVKRCVSLNGGSAYTGTLSIPASAAV